MTWAPMEVQKEIFLLLSADDEIIDYLGGDSTTDATTNMVYDYVPDNSPYPYITLDILPWDDRGNHTFEGLECDFQINVLYKPDASNNNQRGNKPIQLIQYRIDQLLHNVNLCIDGWNSLQLRRTVIDIETDADNVTKHGIQRFNLLIGEK